MFGAPGVRMYPSGISQRRAGLDDGPSSSFYDEGLKSCAAKGVRWLAAEMHEKMMHVSHE